VVLATTLTAQMGLHVAPVLQSAPPVIQSQLDLSQFRNSISLSEGASEGQSLDLGEQLSRSTEALFAQERELVNAALGAGDPQARETLLANPLTEPALKELLQSPTADQAQLDQALVILDQAEQQALEQAQPVAADVTAGVQLSFANSITRIYFYAMWLVVIAFVMIIFWLPELPLRKTNRTEAAPVFE